ncbi:hypothetical protein ADK57_07000 [Streptomyces sp. MMG1533]|nr:hypothetical protein ADK57_07000 [Streptomyces sp. MMG1533]
MCVFFDVPLSGPAWLIKVQAGKRTAKGISHMWPGAHEKADTGKLGERAKQGCSNAVGLRIASCRPSLIKGIDDNDQGFGSAGERGNESFRIGLG